MGACVCVFFFFFCVFCVCMSVFVFARDCGCVIDHEADERGDLVAPTHRVVVSQQRLFKRHVRVNMLRRG